MTEDTIFAIASMTKPITCTAVMMLVEQGKLGLDDPVANYLPELKDLRVLGKAEDDTETESRPCRPSGRSPCATCCRIPRVSPTARSSRPTPGWPAAYDRAGVEGRGLKTIAEQVVRLAKVPLAYQPGEGWSYGLSHDVLGRLIEVVSGKASINICESHIFDVLDMPDTSFLVPEAKRDRVATDLSLRRRRCSDGAAQEFRLEDVLLRWRRSLLDGPRLLSVRPDAPNGGELDGAGSSSPRRSRLMTTNQIGNNVAFTGKYGLGFGLVLQPMDRPPKTPVLDRYFWGGYFSTNFWIDPRHDLAAVIMTQVLPTDHGDADGVLRRGLSRPR